MLDRWREDLRLGLCKKVGIAEIDAKSNGMITIDLSTTVKPMES